MGHVPDTVYHSLGRIPDGRSVDKLLFLRGVPPISISDF